MDKVVSYEQVLDFAGETRHQGQGYLTNFFWDPQKHPYWLENGSLLFEKGPGCYILLHEGDGFCNLFYIASSMTAVADTLETMTFETDCVMDIVCRKEDRDETDVLRRVGFEPYRHLFRMSHLGLLADDSWKGQQGVVFGQEADVPLVYEALQKGFDPLSEQLPSQQEVADYVAHRQLLVVKDGEALCGFLIFELQGKTTWYLRYWFTAPEYRDRRVGSRLLKAALAEGMDTRRQQLWVVSDNENAIKRYEHYGFQREPLTDYVMIKYRQR
mgnify:CR=1 FL=1